jgi:hypothetical protein
VSSVEFRIPISPNAGFFTSVRLIALLAARLGPPYSTARILVSVGDYADLDEVRACNEWATDYPVEWRTVPHDFFEAESYLATANDRFLDSPRADIIVLCDADTCAIARFDDLLVRLDVAHPLVAGLQAHYPPFGAASLKAAENESRWWKLLAGADLPRYQPLVRRYSFDPDGEKGLAPPYFNYGFIAFNRPAFERIAPLANKYTLRAMALLEEPFFSAQIGLALAISASGVNTMQLGHADNCANDDRVFATGLGSENDIRIIHYLRGDEFDRRTFLCELMELRRFLDMPKCNSVTERLRQHVALFREQFEQGAAGESAV